MTTLFLGHGGGPLPLLGDPNHKPMIDAFAQIKSDLPAPKAIIMISAHWEEETIRITGHDSPSLYYDYYNFPPAAYEIEYPAAGNPDLAEQVKSALNEKGIEAELDGERGFDHGMFVPLKLLFPEADIPTIQVSLRSDLDPAFHVELGKAFRAFDKPDILIVGSGLTFHNMKFLMGGANDAAFAENDAFHHWLDETLVSQTFSEEERANRLGQWEAAPGARLAHPREEHLIPVHVCQGAAGKAAQKVYSMPLGGFDNHCYLWG